jgi:hypothetical protein
VTPVTERHTSGGKTNVVWQPVDDDRSHNGRPEHRPYIRDSDDERQAWVAQMVADAKARALANKRAEQTPLRERIEDVPRPGDGGEHYGAIDTPAGPGHPERCDDCGYLIGSRGHQIQCLNMRVYLPRRPRRPRTGGNGMRPMSD